MNERLDNLITTHIKDKKEFFINNILNNTTKINDVLCVDIRDNNVCGLNVYLTDEVIEQLQSNRYVWLLKEHI